MRPSELLALHREDVRRIALRHRAKDVLVFGSVLTGSDTEQSDLDLLVKPLPGMSIMDIGAVQYEVSDLLGVDVDVITPESLPDHLREQVLSQACPV